MPHELGANQSLPITERAQAILSDKDALRASTIADAINDATLNLEVSDISALLVARATALLSRRTAMDPAAEIKGFVRQRVKMNWAALAMPYGSTQNPQTLLFVDRLLYGKEIAVSGAVVGAVAAALFDQAEDAIKAFAPRSRSF